MSIFTPMQWVLFAMMAAALLYGLWHAVKTGIAINKWFERRRAKDDHNRVVHHIQPGVDTTH